MNQEKNEPTQLPLQSNRSRNKLRTVCKWIAIAAVVCIVLGLFVWWVQIQHNKSIRKLTTRDFLHIGMAFAGRSQRTGHLPYPVRRQSAKPEKDIEDITDPNGTGRPLFSWRVDILDNLGSGPVTWDWQQPWDSPANRTLLEWNSFYSYYPWDPSENAAQGSVEDFPETNVMAITGPGTAFGDGDKEQPKSLKDVPPSTILVVESRKSGIPWPAPGDFDIRTMPETINAPDGKGISSRYPGGFHVLFADGDVWFLSNKIPFETLKKLFTVENAKKYDREKLLGPYIIDRGLVKAKKGHSDCRPRICFFIKPLAAGPLRFKNLSYPLGITLKPACSKCLSKVKASVMEFFCITRNEMQSVSEYFLSRCFSK